MFKKQLFYVLAAWLAANTCMAQFTTVKINYDLNTLANTAGPDLGSILPIRDSTSVVNFGYVKVGLVNNFSGEVVKVLDERQVVDAIIKAMTNHRKWREYKLYGLEEQYKIPHKFKSRILYSRGHQVNEKMLAFGLDLPVTKITPDYSGNVLTGIIFMDDQLNIGEFIVQERYDSNLGVNLNKGGYFIDERAFYVSCEVPDGEAYSPEQAKFIYYELKEGEFKMHEDKSIGRLPRLLDYYLGRFYTIFKQNGKYMLFNGESLWETVDLNCIDAKYELPIKRREMFMSLVPVLGDHYAGVVSALDKEGVGREADLVILDKDLKIKKTITRYDLITFNLNSLVYLNNKLYIYLVNNNLKQPLLQTIDLTNFLDN